MVGMASRITYIVSVLVMFVASFWFYPRWKQGGSEAAISCDVSGYYWYLPSVFIYKDLAGQSFKDSILRKYAPTPNMDFQQGVPMENGSYVMKYSSGMAVMYLPFFAAAHALARPLGFDADGFSAPYQFAIQFGGFLISIIGLWYLRKLLLIYYSDVATAISLFLLAIGTNYLNYAAIDCGMSHCWLFTLYTFLLLNTHYFYRQFKVKYALRIGLLVGLATLTRPTDIISCLIPLLWGIESVSVRAIKERGLLILQHFKPYLVAVAAMVVVASIQLIYWKYVSGHWIVYSYGGQEFSWKSPHVWDYTFGYRNGWLLYCPVMLFAFIGLVPFWARGKNRLAITCFFLLNYYVVTAWDVWWYGGRAMIQSYPILIFPLASLVEYVLAKGYLKWVFALVALAFTYFNIWVFRQYHGGGLFEFENMNKRYFWRVVGRWTAPEATIFLRDDTELYEDVPANPQLITTIGFANDTGSYIVEDTLTHTRSLRLDKDHQSSPKYSFTVDRQKGNWLRVAATFRSTVKEWDTWRMPRMIVNLTGGRNGNAVVKENFIRPFRLLDRNETRTISLDMQLPNERFDTANVFFWNAESPVELHVLDIQVTQFSD